MEIIQASFLFKDNRNDFFQDMCRTRSKILDFVFQNLVPVEKAPKIFGLWFDMNYFIYKCINGDK